MASNKIIVLFIAAEAAPLVTAGGLGEVAYALPRALTNLSNASGDFEIDIRVVIPYYPFLDVDVYQPAKVAEFSINSINGQVLAQVFQIEPEPGLIYYLIDGEPVRNSRSSVYAFDAAEDGEKFTFFSLAALEFARVINWKPDLLHANDWHTAAAVYWLALNRKTDPFFQRTASLLNLHNLPYQGEGAGPALQAYGLPPSEDPRLPEWARNVPLPLGLLAADQIVAVSPGYAQEILTTEFGSGLSEFLNTRTETISGILNGIDTKVWDPQSDQDLPYNYSIDSLEKRKLNKTGLQQAYSLPQEERIPLLTMVTRFDHQKGVDLVLDALLQIADLPWQAILLGSGHPDLENSARRLEKILPDRLRTLILYDKSISRQLYGGCDAILIPSRYEPCGLVQMIGMRYGCVPIARATGGLRDTISDYTRSAESTGFLFQGATPESLAGAIRRALYVYKLEEPWKEMQRRGMETDFSWMVSARNYAVLYNKVLANFRST